jgi:uncharacterized protein (DUF2336 family)
MRKKDVVLLATVTSFEALSLPSKSDLKQFAELFPPLFAASSPEAQRQAVAALSQCRFVPDAVALFIGRQPIEVAALFLTTGTAISDAVLVAIAETAGEAHARAIARREALSPMVVDALVGLRHDRLKKKGVEAAVSAQIRPQPLPMVAEQTEALPTEDDNRMQDDVRKDLTNAATSGSEDRIDREEKLRQEIKNLARHLNPPEEDRAGLRTIQPVEMALFARFARSGEIGLFTTALAYALSSTRWLAERILLDMSGQQLATTLVSLGMPDQEAAEVLMGIYPHLSAPEGHGTRADLLLESLDQRDCDLRVDSWLRADTYSFPAAGSGDTRQDAKVRRFRR